MTTRSYAENWEDILLARVFPRGREGFYVHVGAGDPVTGSVTKLFYDRGWSGVNIEPAPARFARLRGERERDVTLAVDLAETTTLAAVCASHLGESQAVDFLAVRAPGRERDVLEGCDWERWRPRVVLVEARTGHDEWEKVLLDADYALAAFNGLTRFYVRSEDRDLLPALATPVNAFDDFVPAAGAARLAELEAERDRLRRDLAAARAVNESFRTMYAGVREVDALQAQTANLEAAAAAISAQCEEARGLIAEALSRYERLWRDVVQTHIEVEAARGSFRSVGPPQLTVAQRLARASAKFPAARPAVKGAVRVARWVKRKGF